MCSRDQAAAFIRFPLLTASRRNRRQHTWDAVMMENAYLSVMILPELGGRIYRAKDKTNGYDFIYCNPVIKPALVGLAGPWISGGIEFNWPQHHRPATFCPWTPKSRSTRTAPSPSGLQSTNR